MGGDTGPGRGRLWGAEWALPTSALEVAVRELLPSLAGAGAAAQVDVGEPGPDDPLRDVPDAVDVGHDLYVWLAGESDVMKRLRRLARVELGLPRTAVACMAYWREGRAES